MPFTPELTFWVGKQSDRQAKLTNAIHEPWSAASPLITRNELNHVIIPAMQLDQPILEGKDTYAILNKGIWRWPYGSSPDKAGNTVLIGHRFTYTNPKGVFYFLDKLKVGDELGIVWDNKNYLYKVNKISVVFPQQTEILKPTDVPTLTMYTCTPLWWPKQRLVVTAILQTEESR